MQINKPYTNIQYADLAIYCNEHNCHIEDKGDYLETVENVPYVPTDEEQRQNRANAYALELDPLTTEYLRKKMFKLFKDGEEETLINSINAKISEIKTLYPYSQAEDEGGVTLASINSILGTGIVTSLSSSNTDTQVPSAKAVYDILGDVETLINNL